MVRLGLWRRTDGREGHTNCSSPTFSLQDTYADHQFLGFPRLRVGVQLLNPPEFGLVLVVKLVLVLVLGGELVSSTVLGVVGVTTASV
jgi:hypothetical protein